MGFTLFPALDPRAAPEKPDLCCLYVSSCERKRSKSKGVGVRCDVLSGHVISAAPVWSSGPLSGVSRALQRGERLLLPVIRGLCQIAAQPNPLMSLSPQLLAVNWWKVALSANACRTGVICWKNIRQILQVLNGWIPTKTKFNVENISRKPCSIFVI